MTKWTEVGGGLGYCESRFPNDKVGHIHAEPLIRIGRNKPVYDFWKAFLDGKFIGTAKKKEDAKSLVEWEYENRYGRP